MYLQIKLYPIGFTCISLYMENSLGCFAVVTANGIIIYAIYTMESPLLLCVETVLN